MLWEFVEVWQYPSTYLTASEVTMVDRSHRTRTVALVGHAGAGKTTLVERLLATTGAIDRAGSVVDGTTVCDTEPEEIARRHSLSTAVAPIVVGEERIDLLDTPGVADFVCEVERALAVADVAVVVVSAIDGVEVQTEVVWRLAGREGIPRVVVITKLDREGAKYDQVLSSLAEAFGKGIAPVELPLGEGPEFCGVADLLADMAITYDESGKATTGPVPDSIADVEHHVREQLVEGIVLADDELMSRYLDGDTLSMEELEAALSLGLADGSVVPVVCVSGETGIGVDRLASLLSELAPSRGVHGERGGEPVEVTRDPEGPTVLRAFKTVLDPFVGRVTWLEVVSGTVRPDTTLVNARTRSDERLRTLQVPKGKELVAVNEVAAGDLVAVPKLADTRAGDVLAPKGFDVTFPLPASAPTHEVAVVSRKQGDEDKLMASLHRLEEEDPGLRVRQDDEVHQTVLTVMGDTHLAVVLERLKRKYGVEVDVEERRHSYRRTIQRSAAAEGRHKKQTGGHGQFAVAHLRVEPLGRGEGFQFADEVVGGAIPRQFIPAVQHGVEKAMASGAGGAIPFVDIKVTCDDGKHHSVDSSEAAFEMAGALAFQEAVAAAGATVLEPISRVEVDVPTRFLGDVLSDLNGRRGRVVSSEPSDDGQTTVVALVPATELARYTTDLRGIAGGHGTFRTTFDHFAELPANLAAKVAAS
jgi:elongation factor G